jgi:hypothetical protein
MKTPLKYHKPSERHKALRLAVLALIKKDAADIPAEEVLAVMSYTVGQLVAMQDQRRFTPDMAMQIVANNLEAGNADAIADLLRMPTKNPN